MKEWFRTKHNLVTGIIAVLHTAGFALKRHIHLHVLVTGGGVRKGQWHELRRNFLTRIDHFRKRFQWRFEYEMILALQRGEMQGINELKLKTLFKQVNHKRWVVAVQKGLQSPEVIVRYIGRYIKRPPFAEQSIREINDGMIRFLSKQSRTQRGTRPARELVSLSADDFMKRSLVHVPLEGFHLVRYYGAYRGRIRATLPNNCGLTTQMIKYKSPECPRCGDTLVYCGIEFNVYNYAKTG